MLSPTLPYTPLAQAFCLHGKSGKPLVAVSGRRLPDTGVKRIHGVHLIDAHSGKDRVKYFRQFPSIIKLPEKILIKLPRRISRKDDHDDRRYTRLQFALPHQPAFDSLVALYFPRRLLSVHARHIFICTTDPELSGPSESDSHLGSIHTRHGRSVRSGGISPGLFWAGFFISRSSA